MKKIILFGLYFIGLYFSATTIAYGENTPAIASGGISMNNTNITLTREELTINPTQVQISYLFENNSKQDIVSPISFIIPHSNIADPVLKQNNDEIATVKTVSLPSFTATVQGQPVSYDTNNSSPKTIFHWVQTFPANQVVLIEVRYVPVPGVFTLATTSNNNSPTTGDFIAKQVSQGLNIDLNNFIDNQSIKDWLLNNIKNNQINAQQNNAVLSNVNYLLTGTQSWKGPIKNFTLTIEKPDNGLVAYNKFYGNQKILSENINNGVRIFIQNFAPKQNLQVVYAVPELSADQRPAVKN